MVRIIVVSSIINSLNSLYLSSISRYHKM